MKRVLAVGYNQSEKTARAASATTSVFALDELPSADVTFSVVPVGCFGKKGNPLTGAIRI